MHIRCIRDLLIRAVESTRGQASLAVDELGDLGVDGLGRDDAPRRDRLLLADAVHPVYRLGLLGRRPTQFGQNDIRCSLEVQSDAGGGEGCDHN